MKRRLMTLARRFWQRMHRPPATVTPRQPRSLTTTTRRLSTVASVLLILAALILLSYSLDRTGWLMALYEQRTPNTPAALLGIDAKLIGFAGALVIEVCAIALLISESIGLMQHDAARRYTNAGLVVVVGIPACANLLAGYLRGFWQVVALLTDKTTGPEYTAAVVIATVFWLVTNAAIPALIFILSKLAAMTLAVAMTPPAPPDVVTLPPLRHDSQQITATLVSLLTAVPPAPDDSTPNTMTVHDAPPLSRTDKVQRLMTKYGKSARTIERWLKDGKVTLEEA